MSLIMGPKANSYIFFSGHGPDGITPRFLGSRSGNQRASFSYVREIDFTKRAKEYDLIRVYSNFFSNSCQSQASTYDWALK